MKSYFISREYLKDDEVFSGYTELMNVTVNLYDKINKGFDQALTLTEFAEIVLLKHHPLATVFIPMKTSLSSMSQLMRKCRSDDTSVVVLKSEVEAF